MFFINFILISFAVVISCNDHAVVVSLERHLSQVVLKVEPSGQLLVQTPMEIPKQCVKYVRNVKYMCRYG